MRQNGVPAAALRGTNEVVISLQQILPQNTELPLSDHSFNPAQRRDKREGVYRAAAVEIHSGDSAA